MNCTPFVGPVLSLIEINEKLLLTSYGAGFNLVAVKVTSFNSWPLFITIVAKRKRNDFQSMFCVLSHLIRYTQGAFHRNEGRGKLHLSLDVFLLRVAKTDQKGMKYFSWVFDTLPEFSI